MGIRYILLILATVFLTSCGGKNQTKAVDWGEATDRYLTGQQLTIKLPNVFKKSSRYRIKNDVPGLSKDGALSYVVQEALEQFEDTDKEIDLYVDTTSQYRFVTILDSEDKIQIDQTAASRLGKLLMEDYDKMDLSKRGLKVTKLESNIKKNNEQQLAKFKFAFENSRKKTKTYVTSFFVTNSTRTLVIHEFSDSTEDLELYTWSINENY